MSLELPNDLKLMILDKSFEMDTIIAQVTFTGPKLTMETIVKFDETIMKFVQS